MCLDLVEQKRTVFSILTKKYETGKSGMLHSTIGVITSGLCSIMLDLHLNLYYWILVRHTASTIQNEVWTLLLPNVMELEAFSLCCFTKGLSGPPWD